MLDLPFCYGVQVAGPFTCTSLRATENLVTCLYRIKMRGIFSLVTITWCKAMVGLGFSLDGQDFARDNLSSCRADMKPWLLGKKKGSKTIEVGRNTCVDVVWDLSGARYAASPEPTEGFFFTVICDNEMVLLLGDMAEDAYERTQAKSNSPESRLISRREHIFGRRYYTTKVQFGKERRTHDIHIECCTSSKEPWLSVKVDRQVVVQVKRLMWKFRGNQTILVDGFPVELFWDVHNWLFSPSDGHAVFMFQTSAASDKSWSSLAASSSVFPWQEASSSSSSIRDLDRSGFSLLLYAWKSE